MNPQKTTLDLPQRIATIGRRIVTGASIAVGTIPAATFVAGTVESVNPLGGVVAATEVVAIGAGLLTNTTSYNNCKSHETSCQHANYVAYQARRNLFSSFKEVAPNVYHRLVDDGYKTPRTPSSPFK